MSWTRPSSAATVKSSGLNWTSWSASWPCPPHSPTRGGWRPRPPSRQRAEQAAAAGKVLMGAAGRAGEHGGRGRRGHHRVRRRRECRGPRADRRRLRGSGKSRESWRSTTSSYPGRCRPPSQRRRDPESAPLQRGRR